MFKLKYLFVAEFEDGSKIEQTGADVSATDKTKSTYFDVVNHPSKLKTFTLKKGLLWSLSLDMKTGIFTQNGTKLQIEDNPLKPDEIVFYRQHQHDMNMNTRTETDHRTVYFIGYKRGEKSFVIGVH